MSKSFFKDYGFAIIFIVVFLLSFIWMGTKRTILSNQNDVTDWLPNTSEETKSYAWFLEHFPNEKFIIVGWEGCTLGDDRVEMLAQKLVPGQTIDNITTWGASETFSAELIFPEEFDFVDPDQYQKEHLQKKPEEPAKPEESKDSDTKDEKIYENADHPNYFTFVLTGPRLLKILGERFPDLSPKEIIDRLDGVLIGPGKHKDGTKIPLEERNTAMFVILTPDVRGKELRNVLKVVHELAVECGIEDPPLPDTRTAPQKLVDSFVEMVREIVYGRRTSTAGAVIGGPPVDNASIDYEGERTLYRLAGLCALFGFVLSMICFRDLRLTFFVFWVSLLSAGIGMAMVWATGSRCDTILLSMPALVYVLAMSGSIHIINYYHDEIRHGGIPGAAERAIKVAWYPCTMAAFTTALGLGSLYMSDLIPIMKFGFYSALGVMLALILMFLYLPALLHFYPSRKFALKYGGKGEEEDNSLITRFWQVCGGFVVKHNKFVAITCLLLMAFFAYGVFQIKVSVKMMRFFTPDSEIITHYTWLENKLGPLVPMEVVVVFDNEKCQFDKDGNPIEIRMLERMRLVDDVGDSLRTKLSKEVGGVMSASTFGPKLSIPKNRGLGGSLAAYSRESATSKALDSNRAILKDYIAFDGNPSFIVNTKNIEAALHALSETEETVDPHELRLKGVNRTEEDVSIVLNEFGITHADAKKLQEAGVTDLAGLLKIPDGRNFRSVTADEIANYKELAGIWQRKYARDIWRISLRVWALQRENPDFKASGSSGDEDEEVIDIDYEAFVQDVRNAIDPELAQYVKDKNLVEGAVYARYTGMVPVVYKTQKTLFSGLVRSLTMSFVLIGIVMMFILKNPIAGLIAMLPNILPVIFTFGFMGHAGILVDLGAMMTASVALGIAVDNTVHYLTWFREGIDQGLDPKAAAMMAYKRCGTAMTQTMLIGGFGLSAFAFSTFTPTQMFGIMMLAILTVSLIGDLLFLPAILTGPAGKFFIKRTRRKKTDA